jgi:ribose/xylose/arabinose/galactoside ABC-type transport system permease subunit
MAGEVVQTVVGHLVLEVVDDYFLLTHINSLIETVISYVDENVIGEVCVEIRNI